MFLAAKTKRLPDGGAPFANSGDWVLENQFGGQLHDSRIGRPGDLAEQRTRDGRAGIAEFRMIQAIEAIGVNLNPGVLLEQGDTLVVTLKS